MFATNSKERPRAIVKAAMDEVSHPTAAKVEEMESAEVASASIAAYKPPSHNEATGDENSTSAVSKVFSIYELAEHIYTYLPLKSIISLLRVQKASNDVIARSKTIQTGVCMIDPGRPIVASPFKRWICFIRQYQRHQDQKKLSIAFMGVFYPLTRSRPHHEMRFRCHKVRLQPSVDPRTSVIRPDEGGSNAFWRKIPVTKPGIPIRLMMLVGLREISEVLKAGATLGDVYEWVCKVAGENDQ